MTNGQAAEPARCPGVGRDRAHDSRGGAGDPVGLKESAKVCPSVYKVRSQADVPQVHDPSWPHRGGHRAHDSARLRRGWIPPGLKSYPSIGIYSHQVLHNNTFKPIREESDLLLSMSTILPELRTLLHPRHPGLSAAVCMALSEAAEVCLARHHPPPDTRFSVDCRGSRTSVLLRWQGPDDTAKRAWNNRDDATRDGAYIVSVAVVEAELGLVAVSRAQTRTGADYYVAQPDARDLEGAYRLEVSGVDAGDLREIRSRLRKKEKQARQGKSSLPAYAIVVGFREASVMISLVLKQAH